MFYQNEVLVRIVEMYIKSKNTSKADFWLSRMPRNMQSQSTTKVFDLKVKKIV